MRGEKNQGFAVLYNNMKNGTTSTKELEDFIRERSGIEETYSKNITKLSKLALNSSTSGTFAPFWQVIKGAMDKVATTHIKLIQKLHELVKEVHKYGEEQQKKHKIVKTEVSGTFNLVQSINTTKESLEKAKETYNTRCIEHEKLKRDSATSKEIEKAETKYKKAMDEYRSLVEKYANLKNDYEQQMTDTSHKFQQIEESHLKEMKDFIRSYNSSVHECNNSLGQIQHEFSQQCEDMTEQKLIEVYVDSKGTGKDKLPSIEFEECDISNIPITETIQKEKTKKKKKAKKKKDKTAENGTGEGESPDLANTQPPSVSSSQSNLSLSSFKHLCVNTPQVDEDGYTIRPDATDDGFKQQQDTFFSESDSDSDSYDKPPRKIHVEIKPIVPDGNSSNTTASVDEIKASLASGKLTLSPAMRRDKSNGDIKRRAQIGSRSSNSSTKSSSDLMAFDPLGSSPGGTSLMSHSDTGSGTSPTSSENILSGIDFSLNQLTLPSSSTTQFSRRGDLFTRSKSSSDILQSPPGANDTQPPTLPAKNRHSVGASSTFNSLPPPPPRSISRPRSIQSPSPAFNEPPMLLPHQDSNSSLTGLGSFNSSPAIGMSRGPSPLTLGMSDTIPIAAAFIETVNAYFKGKDQTKCMVKITGDMMLSFPAGIINVFTSNPSPPLLTFSIRNCNKLEQVLPNKQLISQDVSQSNENRQVYSFNMSALVSLLRSQAEKNAAASFFNVDILKYQVRAQPDAQSSTPLKLCSYWKCDSNTTDLRVDYVYNASALQPAIPLINVSLLVPVDGGVSIMHSKPHAQWSAENNRALWKIPEISQKMEDGGSGSIRAKFELTNGPSKPSTLAVNFGCDGSTLSGIDVDLVGTSYRLSLVKKRFSSGKYLSES
ncbi:F-BAR domain only protein 2-like isoform X2 [Antedon mediterranea]|uniref:F-BAR domain only protein 2-like isoform X2 n=1 Tax=Antedon mediterranea TaxID=105859 RepID=UPI003AF427AE